MCVDPQHEYMRSITNNKSSSEYDSCFSAFSALLASHPRLVASGKRGVCCTWGDMFAMCLPFLRFCSLLLATHSSGPIPNPGPPKTNLGQEAGDGSSAQEEEEMTPERECDLLTSQLRFPRVRELFSSIKDTCETPAASNCASSSSSSSSCSSSSSTTSCHGEACSSDRRSSSRRPFDPLAFVDKWLGCLEKAAKDVDQRTRNGVNDSTALTIYEQKGTIKPNITYTQLNLLRLGRQYAYVPVSLVQLPRVYNDLFELTVSSNPSFCCVRCGSAPESDNAAMCLVCGRILCAGSECCRMQGTGELSHHTRVNIHAIETVT